MAKKKKQTETTNPSDDVIAQAVAEGQALIAEGKTKVEAAMAIYGTVRNLVRGAIVMERRTTYGNRQGASGSAAGGS